MAKIGRILLVLAIGFTAVATRADEDKPWFLSVPSLKMVCLTNAPDADAACNYYIHGVVETWTVWDKYSEPNRNPEHRLLKYCQPVGRVGDKEWRRIVRAALQTTDETGFASAFVVRALFDQLCK